MCFHSSLRDTCVCAAFDRSFEGALAACGAPLVGFLAQHWFGFSVRGLAAAVMGPMECPPQRQRLPAIPALMPRTEVAEVLCPVRGPGQEGRKRDCAACREAQRRVGRMTGRTHMPCPNALMVMTIVPWAFCCICYSGLHFTYPKVSSVMHARCRGCVCCHIFSVCLSWTAVDIVAKAGKTWAMS